MLIHTQEGKEGQMDKNQICDEFSKGRHVFMLIGKRKQRMIAIVGVPIVLLIILLLLTGEWRVGLSALCVWLWLLVSSRVVEERRFVERNLTIIRKAFLASRVTEEECIFQLKGGEVGLSREMLLQNPQLSFTTRHYYFVLLPELQLYLPISLSVFEDTDQILLQTKKQKWQLMKSKSKTKPRHHKINIDFRKLVTITQSDRERLLGNFCIWFLVISSFLLSGYYLWCQLERNSGKVELLPLLGVWLLALGLTWYRSVTAISSYLLIIGEPRIFRPFDGVLLSGNQLIFQLATGWGRFDLAQTTVVYEKTANVVAIQLADEYLYGRGQFSEDNIRYRNIITHQQGTHFFGDGKTWRKFFGWLVIYGMIVTAVMMDLVGDVLSYL